MEARVIELVPSLSLLQAEARTSQISLHQAARDGMDSVLDNKINVIRAQRWRDGLDERMIQQT